MLFSMLGGAAAWSIAAPAANASGYAGKAVYQITISQTCSNVGYCGADNLGGFWGWIALYASGGDGQLTFCGHGAGGTGAGHEALDIGSWTVNDGGTFTFFNTSDPHFSGHPTPIPATPGHYNLHPAPGVETEVTVALNPTA